MTPNRVNGPLKLGRTKMHSTGPWKEYLKLQQMGPGFVVPDNFTLCATPILIFRIFMFLVIFLDARCSCQDPEPYCLILCLLEPKLGHVAPFQTEVYDLHRKMLGSWSWIQVLDPVLDQVQVARPVPRSGRF